MYAPTSRGAAAYRQTQVQCGTPLELVVKLYDAAIADMVKARAGLVSGDLRAKRDAVSRALAILSELQSCLDMKMGGEIASSLDSLYSYISGRIIDFNAKRDLAAIDEAHKLMASLREAWQQIASATPGTPGAP